MQNMPEQAPSLGNGMRARTRAAAAKKQIANAIIFTMKCTVCHNDLPAESVFCTRCGSKQPNAAEPSDHRYAAFISYRHLPRDKEIARKVQRAIEGFKLPRDARTANSWSNPETAPSDTATTRTLGRCFRDEDELTASYSLPERIRTALAQSRMLIVVCTPDTPDSPWVRREIEEFLRLHGRERIITVLASGSSTESIPTILKTQSAIDADGKLIKVDAEPFAADFRPEAAHERKTEMLRVLAAVAGCEYDDLRQRQRKRQRRHVAIGTACTLAFVAIIAALMAWGLSSSQERMIAESKDLAAQSQQQLAQGDRMKALETALAALPSSSSEADRPLVPEAQEALEAAVQVKHAAQGVWCPSFTLSTPGNAAAFTSSTTGSWVAILDDTYTVSVFDLRTGAFRFSIDLADYTATSNAATEDGDSELDPRDRIPNEWAIAAAGKDCLLIANRTGDGAIACFNASTGECRWLHANTVVSSLALSEDESKVMLFSIFENTTALVGILDVGSGDVIDWVEFDDSGLPECSSFLPGYLSTSAHKAYVGMDGFLIEVDFNTGTLNLTQLNDCMAQSLDGYEDTAVTASSYYNRETPGQHHPYSITSAKSGDKIWSMDSTYDYDLVGGPFQATAIDAYPQIRQFINYEGQAIVATAGANVTILRASDGETLFSDTLAHAIVGLGAGYQDDDHSALYIATADGALDVRVFPYDGVNGDSMRTPLPWTIDQATIQWYEGYDLLAILRSAKASNQTLVYRYDNRSIDETVDAPLDDMIEAAQEMLALHNGGEGSRTLVNDPLSRFAPESQAQD